MYNDIPLLKIFKADIINPTKFKIKNIRWNTKTLKFNLLILLAVVPFGVTSNFVLWKPKNSCVTAGARIGVKIVSYIVFQVDDLWFCSKMSIAKRFSK